MNITKAFAQLLLPITFALAASGGQHTEVPMDETHWKMASQDGRFVSYQGTKSIFLPNGIAELKEVDFHNGVIEFDMAFPKDRGFPGIFFRIQDSNNAEEVYFRPHQSGNPDANQYTPSFNRTAGWQLYHGDGYGAPVDYKFNTWNRIRIVIKGTKGELFINDMETPLLQIHDLKHGDTHGPIAIKGGANAHFANFSYVLEENPEFKLPVKSLPPSEPAIIKHYQVSTVLADTTLEGKTWLKSHELSDLSWHTPTVERTGTINLSKNLARSEGNNTALVKLTIRSDRDQVKRLDFGYSDDVRAYVNGQLIYGGTNAFRTRDYRYLGTIGFFDSLYLNLKEGDNEVLFSLKEGFGGWGMKAKIDDQSGLRFD